MKMDMPWLVQRVKRRDISGNADRAGVDAHFTFDYMGSAEFEFGALPKSLREMRAAVDGSWTPAPIDVDGQRAWYIGPVSLVDVARQLFADQLQPSLKRERRLKEWTNIHEAYYQPKDWHCDIVAWWALDCPPGFVLFKQEADAALWLDLLRQPPAKVTSESGR